MKITKREFNRFWDEVLGELWYVDDGECPGDGEDALDDLFDISDIWLAFQGEEGQPRLLGSLGAKAVNFNEEFEPLFREWQEAQTFVRFVFPSTGGGFRTYRMPKSAIDAFRDAIRDFGGEEIKE